MTTITIRARACDGWGETRRFKTLEGAQKYAHKRVGAHPEFGSNYAVSFDGICTVRVEGATLGAIFPEPGATEPRELLDNARIMEIAEYGDGRRVTYAGYDESRHGERVFNTKEDDAARDAENAAADAEARRWREGQDDDMPW